MRVSLVVPVLLLLTACESPAERAAAIAEAVRNVERAQPGSPAAPTVRAEQSPLHVSSAAASVPATWSAGTEGDVPLSIEATVGGRLHRASGRGECATHPASAIHELPVTQWRAAWTDSRDGGLERINLTLWQPHAGGPTRTTLWLDVDGETHRIANAPGGGVHGRATASLVRDGSAGLLTVEGTTDRGTAVRLVVRCERFTRIETENG